MNRHLPALLAAALLAPACAAEGDLDVTIVNNSIATVPSASTCAELGYGDQQTDLLAPLATGSYAIDSVNSVNLSFDGVFFNFSSTIRMDAVLVHGGGDAAVFGPFDPENNGWPSLHPPPDGAGGYHALEKVSFCYDYELLVNPNAWAKGKTSYTWDIEKTGSVANLLLAAGEHYTVDYEVTVTASTAASTYTIEGAVLLMNQTPYTTTVTGVSVMVGEVAATVDCDIWPLPITLGPGDFRYCEFTANVPDTSDRLVVATVTAEGDLPGNSGSELASFATHTTKFEVEDECVDVTDNRYGDLGTVCAGDAPKTFNYSLDIGGYGECGVHEFDNTAAYIAHTTGATGSSTWVVTSEIPCSGGCSLTQGYWKTHSEYGPAPYDDNWANLADGADTAFFLSGQSWYEVLWTAPRGNAYYNLAHQYIAAYLNGLNGANTSAIAGDLAAAQALLEAYTPAAIGALKGKGSTALRNQFLSLAGTLDAYNNGLIGPGHCDESTPLD